MFLFSGIELALIEVCIIFIISYNLKKLKYLSQLNPVLYYWTFFTVFTGIWESGFLIEYNNTCAKAHDLIESNTHVWTNIYRINNIIPWKFSSLFYAEYGAYADREYMLINDNWSRVIEGSHAILCGIFALIAIIYKALNIESHFFVSISICMGAQLMNSVLYMINYFHQMSDPTNINYVTNAFPAGKYLEKRPFMYINIFWTLMPIYCIINLLSIYNTSTIKKL